MPIWKQRYWDPSFPHGHGKRSKLWARAEKMDFLITVKLVSGLGPGNGVNLGQQALQIMTNIVIRMSSSYKWYVWAFMHMCAVICCLFPFSFCLLALWNWLALISALKYWQPRFRFTSSALPLWASSSGMEQCAWGTLMDTQKFPSIKGIH